MVRTRQVFPRPGACLWCPWMNDYVWFISVVRTIKNKPQAYVLYAHDASEMHLRGAYLILTEKDTVQDDMPRLGLAVYLYSVYRRSVETRP